MSEDQPNDIAPVEDLRALTALAHPDRARLMDVLAAHGPQTTGSLAELAQLATGSVSHHLKVLVAAKLVEPAPSSDHDRRKRSWQLVSRGARWSNGSFRASPATHAAAVAADGVIAQRDHERAREFLQSAEPPWEDSAFAVHTWMRLSPEELAELGREIEAVLLSWRRRSVPDDGVDRRTVLAFARGFPSEP